MTKKKVFQLLTHVMPWEIDYCLLLFDSLARAKSLTTETYKIDIDLNLSSYHIDWNASKLDKEYFVDKMYYYSKLLSNFDEVNVKIYDGDDNYGNLDLQKNVVKPDNDYYICISPDQLFNKSILSLFEKSVSVIPNKYFIITPEIPKFWDKSWDVISNKRYSHMQDVNGSYDFLSIDRYDALNSTDGGNIILEKTNAVKYAGWFDLYNKAFYEEIAPVPSEWTGYGQWDLFGMLILYNLSNVNYQIDFSQYKLTNAITTSIEYSNWNYGENRSVYKKRLSIKDVPSQREYYDKVMPEYVIGQLNKIVLSN